MYKQVILISGASSGIGKDAALRLLHEGHTVYGAARREEKMQDIARAGGTALKMDVTDDATVEAAVARVIAEQGRIDVLINNAGFAVYGAVEDVPIDEARRQFEVNLFGLARLTQLVLPHMRTRRAGTIINMSSMGGKIYTPLGAWYHATKYALEGWSDCLRLEVKQFGINVVVIEPGIIATEFGEVMADPLLEHSGEGPYAPLARNMHEATVASYKKGGASPPAVISDLIVQAIGTRHPKTRYVAGKMAKPLLLARKLLSDRLFDKAIMSQAK